MPQIEVTFDIDANGIVHVNAKDLGTGKEQSMTITGGSALPKDDIDRMMREAEQYAEEDRKRREEAETRNNADSLVYQTEKFLAENADKLSDGRHGNKTEVEAALAELKKALEGNDAEAIKAATEKLADGQPEDGRRRCTRSAAPGAEAGAGAAEAPTARDDDDVVEAEIVDERADGNAAR